MNLDKAAQQKADKLLAKISDMEKRERRASLLEAGMLIECSKAAKKAGIKDYKVAMTRALWTELYPWGEDAAKGVLFEEILWDIFKLFKKELCKGPEGNNAYGEFAIIAKTHVKKVVGENVETFANGKSRDKRIEILVTFIPDHKLQPSLVFGLKARHWI
jgi:hypothetical protein